MRWKEVDRPFYFHLTCCPNKSVISLSLLQLNEDIDGEIQLLSQTGPFTLPVKCLTKKCLVHLDKNHFDFGTVYLGETLRQRVIVYNAGALAAEYSISAVYDNSNQTPPSPVLAAEAAQPPAPQSALAAVDLAPNSSKERRLSSNYSIMSNVEFHSHGESTYNLGVIPDDSRLKSKSMGQISFQAVSEAVEGEGDGVEKEGKPGTAGTGLSSEGTPRQRGGSGSPESQSAPGESRSEIHPLSGNRVDTPSISLQETPMSDSQAPQPAEGERRDSQSRQMADTSSKMVVAGQVSTPALPAIQVGESPTGEVGPFGYTPIELVYTPYTVEEHTAKFLISFKQQSACMVGVDLVLPAPAEVVYAFVCVYAQLELTARGFGVDFPVYVEQEEMNMRICMLDRLYQGSVILKNR